MILEILEIVRKAEAFILPLFPKKWQQPPPSFRWIVWLSKRLRHYRRRSKWLNDFFTSAREKYYPAYHKHGWESQLASSDIRFVRFILIFVVFSLLGGLLGKANLFSPWVKGGFLLGSSILFVFGAMHLSISALWLVWGVLFPVYAYLAIGIAPWAISFLSLCALLWHVRTIRAHDSWRWTDFICTLPTLFLWVGSAGKMLSTWSLWQTALLFIALWSSLWAFLVRIKNRPRISGTLQLFFPASLAMITLIGLAKPPLFGIYRWSLWFLGTLGLSLGMARLASVVPDRSFPFQLKGVTLVFLIYGFLILLRTSISSLVESVDIVLSQLFESLEFIWWLIGAGVMLSIRGLVVFLLRTVQSRFNRWVLPFSLWGLFIVITVPGWLPTYLKTIGGWGTRGLWAGLALGATFLTWRRRETLLREWVFWGLFVLFLFHQYPKSMEAAVEQYWAQTTIDSLSFLTISIWLLWLTFSSMTKWLKKYRGRINQTSAVVIMGAFLWLMMALLWVSCVDQQFSIRGRVSFHLFKGLTFLGVPLILYHLVGREYLKLTPSKDVHWGWVIVLGIGLVQILQGIEHAVVAWQENVSFDVFQGEFCQSLLKGIPLEQTAPPWVRNSLWVFSWQAFRWACVMALFSWMVSKSDQIEKPKSVLLLNASFLGLAAWTAETTWIFWPFMPLEWAVILRPWTQYVIWDSRSLAFLGIYLSTSLLWGGYLSLKRGSGRSDGTPALPLKVPRV